ncbi:MAG TPA: sugar phosphate isomerase/epimerase, partial [Gemmatimonadaceae bacterium]|nr:sugar phosphate isomerase/epimerase [Gemmatimonadaceae bacterium]
APASHLPLESLEGERQARTLADAAAAGHEWVVVPWLAPAARRTLDDWRRVAARLGAVAEAARRAGLSFAYHNHDFELAPVEGRVPLELLVAETDAALVKLELDVFWTVKGGADPLALYERWPGRIVMLHLKDSTGAPAHRMVEVGAGTLDWRAILSRGAAQGVRHAFVEHDEPADAWGSVKASGEYLKQLR